MRATSKGTNGGISSYDSSGDLDSEGTKSFLVHRCRSRQFWDSKNCVDTSVGICLSSGQDDRSIAAQSQVSTFWLLYNVMICNNDETFIDHGTLNSFNCKLSQFYFLCRFIIFSLWVCSSAQWWWFWWNVNQILWLSDYTCHLKKWRRLSFRLLPFNSSRRSRTALKNCYQFVWQIRSLESVKQKLSTRVFD